MDRLWDVERASPREPRARKTSVQRFVVMASNAETAIDLAKEEVINPDIGTWKAAPIDGPVVQLRSVLRGRSV